MTTTTIPGPISASVTINRVLPAEGRDNVAQWELHVRWPWTPTANQYDDKTWVNQGDFPNINLSTKGHFPHCQAVKGGLKNKQGGGKHDGTQNWMYTWRILSLDDAKRTPGEPIDSEVPSDAQPERTYQQPEPPQDSIQERIERGMAFNAAVALVSSEAVDNEVDHSGFMYRLRRVRDRLLHEVIQVPVASPHYCYEHEIQRILSPRGKWGHRLPDGTGCIEPQDAAAATGTHAADVGAPP